MEHSDKRANRRKTTKKRKLTANTLALQGHYESLGYKNIAEIAFLMASDSYEDLEIALKEKGLYSEEYEYAFNRSIKAVKNALPYFAAPVKAEDVKDVDDEDSDEAIMNSVAELLSKRKK